MKIEKINCKQVGGCMVKISSAKASIMIDFGYNLDNTKLPKSKLDEIMVGVNAIFITHYHSDHMGLVSDAHIPVYSSLPAVEIYNAYLKHQHKEIIFGFKSILPEKTITIKDISVKAIRINHSAFYSYMYFIEVNGYKILHTGDYNLHGYVKDNILKRLKELPNIDYLITEGTLISKADSYPIGSEIMLSKILKSEKYKYKFVICSSSNIERIKAINDSVKRGSYFVVDKFQKEILDIASKYDERYKFKALTYGKNLKEKLLKYGFTMIIRARDFFNNIVDEFPSEKSMIYYSMWSGYIEENNYNSIYEFMSHFKNYKNLHTSGHATKEEITKVINVLNPRKGVIPIHTEDVDAFDLLDTKISIIKENIIEL